MAHFLHTQEVFTEDIEVRCAVLCSCACFLSGTQPGIARVECVSCVVSCVCRVRVSCACACVCLCACVWVCVSVCLCVRASYVCRVCSLFHNEHLVTRAFFDTATDDTVWLCFWLPESLRHCCRRKVTCVCVRV